jgi:uncharacterized membrane protein
LLPERKGLESPFPGMSDRNSKNDPSTTSFGMAPNVEAFFACMMPVMSGLAFLAMEKKSAFVRFHAMQSLVFGVGVLFGYGLLYGLVWAAANVSASLAPVALLLWVVFIFMWLSLWIVQLVAAFTGKEWEMPWFGKLSRRLLARLDARTPAPPEE